MSGTPFRIGIAVLLGLAAALGASDGTLKLRIIDGESDEPTPARVVLTDAKGVDHQPVPEKTLRVWDESTRLLHCQFRRSSGVQSPFYSLAEWEDRFPAGTYTLLVEKGFEYVPSKQSVEIPAGGTVEVTAELHRWVNMPAEGWMNGDAHVHFGCKSREQALKIIELCKAEDVHNVLLLLSQSQGGGVQNQQYAWGREGITTQGLYSVHPAEECTNDAYGHMSFMGITKPILPIGTGDRGTASKAEYPPNIDMCRDAIAAGGFVIGDHGGHGEFAVDVALGAMKGVEILQGNRWSYNYENENLYAPSFYHILNSGFRIVGVAGSDYPVLSDKIFGNTRNYVFVGGELTPEAWIENFQKGRSFLTNGPMLDFTVDGKMPGETIAVAPGQKVKVVAKIRWHTPMKWCEFIVNGEPVGRLDDLSSGPAEREFTQEIEITESVWVVFRAFGEYPEKRRGYYYVHANPVWCLVDEKPVIVPASVKYWIARINDLSGFVKKAKFDKEEDRRRTLAILAEGRAVYEALLGGN